MTVAAGVPTIWMGVLPELKGRDTSRLRAIPCGGSAVPKALSEAYREQIGLPILQAWGMTETSPIASVCRLDADQELAARRRAGRPAHARSGASPFGVDCRVVDPDTTDEVPWDGETSGELQCRGNVDRGRLLRRRHGRRRASPPTAGCARATSRRWTPRGRIRLVDRTKDLIKSGGEWISSVELENELMAPPRDRRGGGRRRRPPEVGRAPLACVVREPGATLTEGGGDRLSSSGKVAKWQLPDDVVFIDEVPKTSVGKFSKKTLRDEFATQLMDA